MAGRAGRRGLDTTGTVIIVSNDSLPEVLVLQLITSAADALLANDSAYDDSWNAREAFVPIQANVQHDPQSVARGSPPCGRND